MTFIDRLFDSLETPGPNSKWMEENSAVIAKAYAEMKAEMAMPSAPAVAASPSSCFASRPSGLPSVSQEN